MNQSIRKWRDNWLEGFGLLEQHATQIIPEELVSASVADMIVLIMAYYLPPSSGMENDAVYWRNTTSGTFTTQSAYDAQINEVNSSHRKDPIWRLVWKWKGLEWIKAFLWTVAQNGLLTNEA
ncbi:hypothetical protein Peur_039790 [Populus x canadensis]